MPVPIFTCAVPPFCSKPNPEIADENALRRPVQCLNESRLSAIIPSISHEATKQTIGPFSKSSLTQNDTSPESVNETAGGHLRAGFEYIIQSVDLHIQYQARIDGAACQRFPGQETSQCPLEVVELLVINFRRRPFGSDAIFLV